MSATVQGSLFKPDLPLESFWVWVSPAAKQTAVLGWVQHQDRTVLKLRVQAQAEDGKANAEVLEVLGKWFQCAKSRFTIESGHTFRFKRIGIVR